MWRGPCRLRFRIQRVAAPRPRMTNAPPARPSGEGELEERSETEGAAAGADPPPPFAGRGVALGRSAEEGGEAGRTELDVSPSGKLRGFAAGNEASARAAS